MISQIEHGTANASVPVLRAIARVLEVPLFTFFVDDDVRDALVRRQDRRQLHIPGSQVTRELLVPDIHRRIVMLVASMPPGSISARDFSSHQGEECFVVTRGSVQLDINNRTVELNEGDSYYLDSNVPHLFRNVTDEPAEIIVAITAK
jgi:quercetin dioxygenase-like cupin family protein